MDCLRGKLCALLSVAILVLGLAGCAAMTNGSTWNPGEPDALTNEHYDLVVAAIDKHVRTDAQAALKLLGDDETRMQTNAPTMMAALARLYGVGNAVDAGDWEKARTGILELKASYGRH